MTHSILARRASSIHTESSAYPELVRRIVPASTGAASPVLIFEAAVVHAPQRPGWRDIRDRIAELERNPKRAQALARARQRFAKEVFSQRTLSAMRLEKGLSQAELARRIGTSQSRLSRIEAGLDDPRRSTLVKLSEALGEPLDAVSKAIGASADEQNV